MGPHPETPVDVQKYIGPCLITQQVRNKRKSCPKEGRYHLQAGYGMTNYAWTGVPLISVVPRRRGGPAKPQDHPEAADLEEILPISRLAIHAQGAPLILSPKEGADKEGKEAYAMSPAPFKGHDFYMGDGSPRLYVFVPPHESAPSPSFLEEDSRPVSSSSPSQQSDCISTTSEDSVTSENGLPRIIKPRKRRRKDRRPSESDIVTLKPYQPLCYRYGGFAPPSPTREPEGRRSGAYPYSPSPRCRCPHCVPPPSTLLTPPDSPGAEDQLLSGRGNVRFLPEEGPNFNGKSLDPIVQELKIQPLRI